MRDAQRGRILLAAAEAVADCGVAGVTVAAIVVRAGVSRRTFYELFDSTDDCLRAAFEETVRQAKSAMREVCERQESWPAQIRAGLAALLSFIDQQPSLGRFAVVGALGVGEEVLRLRVAAIAELADVVDEGRALAQSTGGLSRTTAEGLVGGALSIVHTRLVMDESVPALGLLAELMAMLVRPYLGAVAAAAELRRAAPPSVAQRHDSEILHKAKIRWTYRTMRVLRAVAERPGASNREISTAAGKLDQGQTSKLLARLERIGLVENRREHPRHVTNAWHLTDTGTELNAAVAAQMRGGEGRGD